VAVGIVGAAVGTAVDAALGVADADAEAEGDTAPAALGAAWLLLSDEVQPATLTISTARRLSITTIFNVILVIFHPPQRKNKKEGSLTLTSSL
jgi:hypothetical protein